MTAPADNTRTSTDVVPDDLHVRDDHLTSRQEARGYSWQALQPGTKIGLATRFKEGHTRSLEHGANSERIVSPLAAELLEGLDEHAPWTAMPAFSPLRLLWAHAGAEYLLRFDALDARGVTENKKGDGYDRLDRCRDRFERLSEKLGLGPMALAKLLGALGSIDGPASAQGLDALKAAGAELARQARERSRSPVPPQIEQGHDEHEQGHDEGGDGDV